MTTSASAGTTARSSSSATTTEIDARSARQIALAAALLRGDGLPADENGILAVASHFGGIQIDPTRTVERTQYLVLWSRLGTFDRSLLSRLVAQRRLFEWNAFIVPVERLPELLYVARRWPAGEGNWSERVRHFLDANARLRQSILDQLRANGPLLSRQVDGSELAVGWQSTGWTDGKSVSQMLEFMSVKLDVVVAGRIGQERLWDVAERVIPADAPRAELTDDQYEERRVMRAMRRFGVATLAEIRSRAYGLGIAAAKALLGRLVEDGRLVRVDLPYARERVPGFALADALASDAGRVASRTTLISPFDPLVYHRERTERLFGFRYKLEMYVPKAQREFGHFVLPIVHGDRLVGRLDSERDRRTNELVVKRVYWEEPSPDASARAAADAAIAELAEFVRSG